MKVARTVPIFRIFSVDKAREFYLDWLGCTLDWEHRFEPDLPLYMQVSRGGLVLHLSEHHGDATPGAAVYIEIGDVDALHRELSGRRYTYLRPAVEETPWGMRQMRLTDPFGNRLNLNSRV